MKALLLVLFIVLISGCTTYSIEKGVDENGNFRTKVDVSSTRDLEQPRVDYKREGADAEFHFSAASVDNNTESFMAMFQGVMTMMMEMMKASMIMNAGPVE